MIQSFSHKGLKRYFIDNKADGIPAIYVNKIKRILDILEVTEKIEDIQLPNYGLHQLKGNRADTYSMAVSANFRITFKLENNHVTHVDLEDYH